jgi:hypothetical protein
VWKRRRQIAGRKSEGYVEEGIKRDTAPMTEKERERETGGRSRDR